MAGKKLEPVEMLKDEFPAVMKMEPQQALSWLTINPSAGQDGKVDH